jgi:hypothetical protein
MAETRITCPSCKVTLKVANALPPGKLIKCPKCSEPFRVPGPDAKPGPPAKAAPAADIKKPTPAAKKAAAPDEADDEEREEEAPRRRPAPAGAVTRQKPRPAGEDEEERDEEDEEERPRRRKGAKRAEDEEEEPPARRSLALRVSILVLGILGGGVSGTAGFFWVKDATSPTGKAIREALAVQAEAGVQEAAALKSKIDRFVTSAYCLLAAAALGIAGGVLAFRGMNRIGGGLMLGAVPLPLFFNPSTLIGTYFLLLGGGLCFLAPLAQATLENWSTKKTVWVFVGGWVSLIILWFVLIPVLVELKPKFGEENEGGGKSRRRSSVEWRAPTTPSAVAHFTPAPSRRARA